LAYNIKIFRKSNSYYKLLRYIIFTIGIIGLFTQCDKAIWRDPDQTDWGQQLASSPAARKRIAGFRAKVDEYYSSNPDSSIFYCHKLINTYSDEKLPSGVFNIYNFLSEIYLHRKADPINAMRYHSEALKIMKKHKWRETGNPYFFIDMGNLQLVNNINNGAITSYHKALILAEKAKINYAVSLAQNNLGIAFAKVAKYDSACYYYHKARVARKEIMPLLVAQSDIYLAKAFVEQNKADSILYYRNLAYNEIKKQSYTNKGLKPVGVTYAIELLKTLKGDLAYLMAVYFEKKDKPEQAINYYKSTIQQAISRGENPVAISGLYSIASIYDKEQSETLAFHYADSCYRMSINYENYVFAVKSAKLLGQFCLKNNPQKTNFYLTKAMSFTDSIKKDEMTEKEQNSMVLLISTQTEDSLLYYQVMQEKDGAVMHVQTISISLLIVLLIVLCILIYIIVKKQQQLKEEHLRQMETVLKNIEKEDKNKLSKQNKTNTLFPNQFEERFAELMENQKVYTQKTLSLADLARQLETNVNYLSQFFNNQLETNFNDYINSLRVKEACRIFKNDTEMKFSVDQVADMVGFSSRSTFYTTFKKFAGVTPAFFQKNLSDLNDHIHESKTTSI